MAWELLYMLHILHAYQYGIDDLFEAKGKATVTRLDPRLWFHPPSPAKTSYEWYAHLLLANPIQIVLWAIAIWLMSFVICTNWGKGKKRSRIYPVYISLSTSNWIVRFVNLTSPIGKRSPEITHRSTSPPDASKKGK